MQPFFSHTTSFCSALARLSGIAGVCLLLLSGCGNPHSPDLGILFSPQIKQSDLQLIRSFRILAFVQGIYQCNATEHSVRYDTGGFAASATFDWSLTTGIAPQIQLYLPKDAIQQQWIIQIEAFSVVRASQTGEVPIATGCTPNILMFDERPVTATVELHSRK